MQNKTLVVNRQPPPLKDSSSKDTSAPSLLVIVSQQTRIFEWRKKSNALVRKMCGADELDHSRHLLRATTTFHPFDEWNLFYLLGDDLSAMWKTISRRDKKNDITIWKDCLKKSKLSPNLCRRHAHVNHYHDHGPSKKKAIIITNIIHPNTRNWFAKVGNKPTYLCRRLKKTQHPKQADTWDLETKVNDMEEIRRTIGNNFEAKNRITTENSGNKFT